MGLTSSILAAQRQSLLRFTLSESHEVSLNLSYICTQAVLLQATSSGVNLVNSLSPNTAWSKVLLFTCFLLQSQKCLRATPPETGQKMWKTSFIRKPRIKWGFSRYWEQSTRKQNRRHMLYKVLSPTNKTQINIQLFGYCFISLRAYLIWAQLSQLNSLGYLYRSVGLLWVFSTHSYQAICVSTYH